MILGNCTCIYWFDSHYETQIEWPGKCDVFKKTLILLVPFLKAQSESGK